MTATAPDNGSMLDLLSHPAFKTMPADVAAHFGALLAEMQRWKDERNKLRAALTKAQTVADGISAEYVKTRLALQDAQHALTAAGSRVAELEAGLVEATNELNSYGDDMPFTTIGVAAHKARIDGFRKIIKGEKE